MNETSSAFPDLYDRLIGSLVGLPDVTSTKITNVRTIVPVVGNSQSWTVQTFRQQQRDETGAKALPSRDTIFLECGSKDGLIRLAIPYQVADAIARQREALTARVRSKSARATAQARKERGEIFTFQKKGKK